MEIERKVAVTAGQSANILERKRIAQCLFLPRLCPSAFYKFLIDRDPHRLSMTRSSDCTSEMRKWTMNRSPRSVNSEAITSTAKVANLLRRTTQIYRISEACNKG